MTWSELGPKSYFEDLSTSLQKDQPNSADKLGKFDIDKENVDKWMTLATEVLFPPWLQVHPNNYLEKMLNNSREQIQLLKQGGKANNLIKQQGSLYEENDPGTVEANHVNCYEAYIPISSFQGKSLRQFITPSNC